MISDYIDLDVSESLISGMIATGLKDHESLDMTLTLDKSYFSGAYTALSFSWVGMAVIVALEALNRPCEVEVHSDSQYVVNAFNKHWIDGWKKRGWKTANKQPVKNRDLWERLITAKSKHKVEFIWVKGHAGHELNERCDELATTAADGANLDIDTGFNESDL